MKKNLKVWSYRDSDTVLEETYQITNVFYNLASNTVQMNYWYRDMTDSAYKQRYFIHFRNAIREHLDKYFNLGAEVKFHRVRYRPKKEKGEIV